MRGKKKGIEIPDPPTQANKIIRENDAGTPLAVIKYRDQRGPISQLGGLVTTKLAPNNPPKLATSMYSTGFSSGWLEKVTLPARSKSHDWYITVHMPFCYRV